MFLRLQCVVALFVVLGIRDAGAAAPTAKPDARSSRRNVLLIAVDDLRPELGAYGATGARTPHMDALARRGTLFQRAYVQQAVCSPSRTVLLTGRRPDTTKVYDLQTHFRVALPDVTTLPQHFKSHGYHSQALGKILHGGLDDPRSWSVPHWTPKAPAYSPAVMRALEAATVNAGAATRPKERIRGPAWESVDAPDEALADGQTADRAVATLRDVKNGPFFLAVGFSRPHLPFVAPRKYFDLHPPLEQIAIASNPSLPTDAPAIAGTKFGELRAYQGVPADGPLPAHMQRELIRAYHASVSFVDAQIGRVLEALDELGLRDDTIVVLWGDHGWQLGEHGLWCKHTNYEVATRTTLIVSAPGQKRAGVHTNALVETVDLFPTVTELARLPASAGLEGTSFAPLLDDPKLKWKPAAFSQYPRGKLMGYAMRTDRYRYVEWRGPDRKAIAVELYDHAVDRDENVNVAGVGRNKPLVAGLARQLAAGWRSAVPRRAGSRSATRATPGGGPTPASY